MTGFKTTEISTQIVIGFWQTQLFTMAATRKSRDKPKDKGKGKGMILKRAASNGDLREDRTKRSTGANEELPNAKAKKPSSRQLTSNGSVQGTTSSPVGKGIPEFHQLYLIQ